MNFYINQGAKLEVAFVGCMFLDGIMTRIIAEPVQVQEWAMRCIA